MRVLLVIWFGMAALAGCTSATQYGPLETPAGPTSNVQIVSADALPPPTLSDRTVQFRPYRIGPFDRLAIDVFGVDELERREYRTDAGGRVSYPLAGVIEAGGLTPAELEREIEQRLRGRYIRDPQVTVNLVETVSQVVTVSGEVIRPGLYPVIGQMTLRQAIATAQGVDEYAKREEVLVFRTVDGQEMAAVYNLAGINAGNYEDPEVYANDVIVVGDSPERRRLERLQGLGTALLSPLIILLTR